MQDNHVKDDRVRDFVAALRRFEQDGDESLLELFASEATATRLDARGDRTDVASFWKEYRAQFTELSTTFTNSVEGAEQAALEWVTRATLTSGRPVEYRGVTVLDRVPGSARSAPTTTPRPCSGVPRRTRRTDPRPAGHRGSTRCRPPPATRRPLSPGCRP